MPISDLLPQFMTPDVAPRAAPINPAFPAGPVPAPAAEPAPAQATEVTPADVGTTTVAAPPAAEAPTANVAATAAPQIAPKIAPIDYAARSEADLGALQGTGRKIIDIENQKRALEEQAYNFKVNQDAQIAQINQDQTQKIYDEREKWIRTHGAPTFQPTGANTAQLASLFTLLGLGAVALGGKGKYSALNAQAAMTGMIEGWNSGIKDQYDRQKQIFDENFKAWQADVAQTKELFDVALDKAKTIGIPKAVADLEARLNAQGKSYLAAQLKINGLTGMQGALEKVATIQAKTADINRSLAADAAKHAQPAIGPKAFIGNALRVDASQIPNDAAKSIVANTTALYGVKELREDAKDPDINFGSVGVAATKVGQQFNAALQSFGLTTKDLENIPRDEAIAYVEQALNSMQLDPNDKNAVFVKKAAFVALDIERAVRGGSFLPIGFVKTIGPLLDPKSYTREAFRAILKTREDELMRSFAGMNIGKAGVDQLLTQMSSLPGLYVSPAAGVAKAAPSSDTAVIKLD
jgi:hypothetical protein